VRHIVTSWQEREALDSALLAAYREYFAIVLSKAPAIA